MWMPQSCPWPAMMNPTVVFDITIAGEPFRLCLLHAVCRQSFKDSRKLLCSEHWLAEGGKGEGGRGEGGTGYKDSWFHRIIWNLCARLVTSHAIMAQAASPSMGRNLKMKHAGPGISSMANVGPNTSDSAFHLHCQGCGWTTSVWTLARWKRA